MDRRDVLKGIGLLLGGSLSPPVVAAAVRADIEVVPTEEWVPRTLDASQDRLVTAIAEAILPTTDTPGAAAAGVNQFIDLLLSEWLEPEEVDRFLAGLAAFAAHAVAETGRPFEDLDAEQQLVLLVPLDRQAVEHRASALAAGVSPREGLPFLGAMKELTLIGYYTSEIGMTQELRQSVITSSYEGCVPYEEIGRSWA